MRSPCVRETLQLRSVKAAVLLARTIVSPLPATTSTFSTSTLPPEKPPSSLGCLPR